MSGEAVAATAEPCFACTAGIAVFASRCGGNAGERMSAVDSRLE